MDLSNDEKGQPLTWPTLVYEVTLPKGIATSKVLITR
jgi:hypothetical protein